MRGTPLAIVGIACFLAGCEDPIVGDWEAEIDNIDWELTFASNGVGQAEGSPEGITGKIYFDIEWKAKDDKYEVELDCKRTTIEGLTCAIFDGDQDYECEIDSSGDLSCELEDCSNCDDAEFERVED